MLFKRWFYCRSRHFCEITIYFQDEWTGGHAKTCAKTQTKCGYFLWEIMVGRLQLQQQEEIEQTRFDADIDIDPRFTISGYWIERKALRVLTKIQTIHHYQLLKQIFSLDCYSCIASILSINYIFWLIFTNFQRLHIYLKYKNTLYTMVCYVNMKYTLLDVIGCLQPYVWFSKSFVCELSWNFFPCIKNTATFIVKGMSAFCAS